MGLTVTTLHIPGEASAVLPLLKKGETVRTHSPGWTTVLPAPGTPDCGALSLEKLAKRMPGVCLYFHYFDDDMFLLALYEKGKRTATLATCDMMGRSSKVDRISPAIFGDDRATAALKLIAKCTDVEEQLALAEEALGVSLLEDAEFPPRQVTQGTATYDAVTARMAALKKRKNAYRAVPLGEKDVPPTVLAAYSHPDLTDGWLERVTVPPTDVQGRPLPPEVQLHRVLGSQRLDDGSRLYTEYYLGQPDEEPESYGLRAAHYAILCRGPEGGVRWVFQPELGENDLLQIKTIRAETVMVGECAQGRQERLWLLRRTDGQVLHEAFMEHEVFDAWWIPALERYVFFSRDEGSRRSCTLMDASLNVTRWTDLGEWGFLPDARVSVEGTRLITQQETDAVVAFELTDCSLHTTRLEDRAYFCSVPTPELIYGRKGNSDIILFDRTGRLVSRHRFKGSYVSLTSADGHLYAIERMGREIQTCQYWRLEKI